MTDGDIGLKFFYTPPAIIQTPGTTGKPAAARGGRRAKGSAVPIGTRGVEPNIAGQRVPEPSDGRTGS